MSGDESFEDDTPVLHFSPESPLGRVQSRLDGRVDRLGGRFGKRLDDQDEQLVELGKFRVALVGLDGTNGKIGTLSGRVGMLFAILGAVGALALGSVSAALIAVDRAGREKGSEATRLEHAEKQLDKNGERLQALEQMLFRLLMPAVTTPTSGGPP